MKIYNDNPITQLETMNYRTRTENNKKPEETGTQLDRITINASSDQIKEKEFVNKCTDKLVNEVCSSKSEERIERLKQQVADGTYQPDIESIAAKILLSE